MKEERILKHDNSENGKAYTKNMKELRIHPADNVVVNIETGHKSALVDIAEGENVIKYGFPIGHATQPIKKGEHVHNYVITLKGKGKICKFC